MTTAPILAYPRRDVDFILDTDASNFAIGAVLSQEQDGQERVLAYASKTLNRAEQNYCYNWNTVQRKFTVGAWVWLYDASRRRGVCPKLTPNWKGPFMEITKLSDVVYCI